MGRISTPAARVATWNLDKLYLLFGLRVVKISVIMLDAMPTLTGSRLPSSDVPDLGHCSFCLVR